MAKYLIKHSCGHEEEHSLFGPYKDRDRKEEWLKSRLCSECWRAEQEKQRERQNQEAAKANAEAGLPTLTGSPKQVTWAETIRAAKLADLPSLRISPEKAQANPEGAAKAQAALDQFIGQISAAWWIDHRQEDGRDLFRAIYKKL